MGSHIAAGNTHESATGEAPAVPPRYRWLKRMLAAVCVLLVGLTLLRVGWGFVAERKLTARIEAYHARGEPILASDFVHPAPPDKDNAAYYLTQASQALVTTPPGGLAYDDVNDDMRLAAEQPAEAGKMLIRQAAALKFLRQARLAPGCDWQIPPDMNSLNTAVVSFGSLRALAKLGCATAVIHHERGNDAEAVESLFDVFSLAERTGRMGLLISGLVSSAIEGLAVSTMEYIAPRLLVHDTDTTARLSSVPRKRVRELVSLLLSSERFQEAWRYSIITERAYELDIVQSLSSGSTDVSSLIAFGTPAPMASAADKLSRVAFTPLWRLWAVDIFDDLDAVAKLKSRRDLEQARRDRPHLAGDVRAYSGGRFRTTTKPVDNYNILYIFLIRLRDRLRSHLAAAALAIRLYELDHGGRPDSLAQLVPEYLSVVPTDPLAADGRPLGYLPLADVPILYSVGRDGVDHGGQDVLGSDGARDRDRSNLRFHLNRADIKPPAWSAYRAATQPSSEDAAGDEPSVDDQDGNDDQR